MSASNLSKGFADKPSRGPGDVDLYKAEVERIRSGESYYSAAGAELRKRGYPTRSVFNWRTPLPMWLLGVLPGATFGKALLGGLALVSLLTAFELLGREGGRLVAVVGTLALCGALLPCLLGDLYVMPVLWAGVLLLLSITLLGLDWKWSGIAAGVAAVFVRDLAGPYCVLSFLLAVCRRRFSEALGWAVGLGTYGLYFLWHANQITAQQALGGTAQEQSWVQFGGLAFVIATTQLNAFLLVMPQWLSAIYLPLALLGLAGWSSPPGERAGLTASAYVLLFGFVGQDINQYWGSLIAPVLCLGAGWSVRSLADLWSAAVIHRPASGSVSVGASSPPAS